MEREILRWNEAGRLIDSEGIPVNMFDFVSTKPYIKRYYDYNTTNKSFLNFHILLKKLGIENNNEHLQIFNPALIGVDPFSTALTDDIKQAILNEIIINPWYYFREIFRSKAGENYIRFSLDVLGFTNIFCTTRRINSITEASRQTGKTFSYIGYLGYLLNFVCRNTEMGNVHMNEKECAKNIKLMEDILSTLPDWLKLYNKNISLPDKDGNVKVKDKGKSAAKKTSLSCDMWGNKIDSHIVGNSPEEANKTGRGRTVPIWFVDEIAHIKYNDTALGSLTPSFTRASETARKNGLPFGIWQACTPGDLKTDFGKWVYENITKEFLMFGVKHFKMFDMTEAEAKNYIKLFSRRGTVYIRYDHVSLGYGNGYLTKATSGIGVDKIRSDVLLRWETQTTHSPFTQATLTSFENAAIRVDKKCLIEYKHDDEGNVFYLYPRIHADMVRDLESLFFVYRERGLVFGIDTAFGVGGEADATTLVGVDPTTLEIVCIYKRNDIAVDQFAILVMSILDRYAKRVNINIGLAVERNSNGLNLIELFKRNTDFSRYLVVYTVPKDRLNDPTGRYDYKFMYNGINNKFDVGLSVNANTRAKLMNLLIKLVTKHTDALAVMPISTELKTLIVKKDSKGNTKIEHAEGMHDDVIFGALHAYYAIFYNADILQTRNRIEVKPENFLVNDGVLSLNTTGKLKMRIRTSYVSRDNKLIPTYYDTVQNRYVDEETAKYLMAEDKDNGLLSSEEKDPVLIEEDRQKQEMIERIHREYGDQFEVTYATIGDKVLVETPEETQRNNDEWFNSLFDN